MIPLALMALATGFLGSGHCVGMCGPLVCALAVAGGRRPALFFHLAYNLGRLLTYTGIGMLAGGLGSALATTRSLALPARAALVAGDLFVVTVGGATLLAGLGVSRFSLGRLESGGLARLVRHLAAGAGRLPPALAPLALGLVMGFLPCGFFYPVILAAAQAGSSPGGGLVTLAFGAGTLPALFGAGFLAGLLSHRGRQRLLAAAGLMILLMGSFNLWRHLQLLDWILAAIPYGPAGCH